MPEPIVFPFVSQGLPELLDGLDTVSKKSKRTDADVVAGARRRAAEEERAAAKTAKAAEKAAAAQERELKRVEAARSRSLAKQQKEEERAAKAAETAEKRAADAKIRERERAEKYVAAIRTRHFAKEQKDQERAEKADAAARETRLKKIGRGVSGFAAGAVLTGTALATGLVGGATRESLQLEEMANRLSINSRRAGQEFVDPSTLRREFEGTAAATPGIKAADIAEATTLFAGKTKGNLDAARLFQGTFATAASASGNSVQDVADVGATLMKKFDIKTVEGMRDAMASLVLGAKEGGMSVQQASEQLGKLSAAASRFGFDKSPAALRELGGLSRIAREGTGSAEGGEKAVEMMLKKLMVSAPKLAAQGVRVFDKTGHTRDIKDILPELIGKTGGTNLALKRTMLEKEMGKGYGAIAPLFQAYEAAFRGTQGTNAEKAAAAQRAVTEALERAMGPAAAWGEVTKDAAQAQQDASAQLHGAWEQLSAAVGEKVTPKILEMVPAVTKLATTAIPMVVDVFGELAKELSGLVSFLESKGLIETKKDAAATGRKTYREEAAAIDKQIAELAHDPEIHTNAEKYQKRIDLEKRSDELHDLDRLHGEEQRKLFADQDIRSTVAESRPWKVAEAIVGGAAGGAGTFFGGAAGGVAGTGAGVGVVRKLHGLVSTDEALSADQAAEERRQFDDRAREDIGKVTNLSSDDGAGKLGTAADKHADAADKLSGVVDKFSGAVDKLSTINPNRELPLSARH